MAQDGKGEASTVNLLLLVGTIVIGIWFLTVVSDFINGGISPVYALFFFLPICGVFLLIVVFAGIMNSASDSSNNKTELSGEDSSSEINEKQEKNDISIGQFLRILVIIIVILFVMFLSLI